MPGPNDDEDIFTALDKVLDAGQPVTVSLCDEAVVYLGKPIETHLNDFVETLRVTFSPGLCHSRGLGFQDFQVLQRLQEQFFLPALSQGGQVFNLGLGGLQVEQLFAVLSRPVEKVHVQAVNSAETQTLKLEHHQGKGAEPGLEPLKLLRRKPSVSQGRGKGLMGLRSQLASKSFSLGVEPE